MKLNRRVLVGAGASWAALMAAGCSDQPAFHGIDITGADYAQDFDLVDHNGQRRTLADFKGQVVVVFFGFTQCPDVCPTSMAEMAHARALLGQNDHLLQGLFVSVDPERDTPEIMREYMASFDDSFLALYTDLDKLPELAKSFKVYYKKVDGPTPTSYSMDHSAGSYVFDTQGRIRLYHRYNSGAEGLASDLKRLLAEKA
jgi:protein SCO1/2